MDTTLNRRSFIRSAPAASAGTAAAWSIVKPGTAFGTQANSAIRMGIIGCGGRGTAVATSFMKHTDTRVVALADLFEDRLNRGQETFSKLAQEKGFAAVDKNLIFRGSRAYTRILESKEVDAVLVSSPPFLHPEHLLATVEAGKHVYCEKPVAVDPFGCQQVLQAGKKAEGKVSLAVGFQIRHATPFVELAKRIHTGAIGDIVSGEAYYYASALKLPAYPGASAEESRLRHWVWDRHLSGDIIVEQNIHIIDVCNWFLKGHPVKAVGFGGRKGRTDDGNCWSHFNVTYLYPNDVHVSVMSTQFDPGLGDVCERFFGTKGISESHYSGGVFIKGENAWDSGAARSGQAVSAKDWATGSFRSALDDADANKEKAFIESIRSGKRINEAAQGVESALTAIMGREAAYSQKEVTWQKISASKEKWDPKINLKQFDK